MVKQQIASIEASLVRLSQLLPGTPRDEVLLVRLVLLLAQHVNLMLEHQIRPHGLGDGEFRVLVALYSQPQGTANPSELCARAAQSPANMSRITDALVDHDLITRVASEEDRRRWVLGITDKGVALVRRVVPQLHGPVRQMCAGLPPRDLKRVIAQLKQCLTDLDAATPATEADKGV